MIEQEEEEEGYQSVIIRGTFRTMPSRLNTPVLTVDVGLIHKVDTRNVENLFSMWSGMYLLQYVTTLHTDDL